MKDYFDMPVLAGADLQANDFIRLATAETCRIENGGEGELRLIAAAVD